MKVLLLNGSRRERGCTYTALTKVSEVLNEEGIETEIIHVGTKAVNGEMDSLLKEVSAALKTTDGIIVGSPVYYASPSGEILAFLDRLFIGSAGADLRFKPAACVVSARRAGTTAAFDVLNKYFSINQMPIVSSMYWNMVHGNKPEEVEQDAEGIQIMQTLGRNMAWILKSIEAGKNNGVKQPTAEEKIYTNFIR